MQDTIYQKRSTIYQKHAISFSQIFEVEYPGQKVLAQVRRTNFQKT